MQRLRVAFALTTAVSAAVTAAIALIPEVRFAYRSPPTHAAIETASGVVALVSAWLIYARYGRDRGRNELLMALGFGAIGVSNLVLSAIPAAAETHHGAFASWAPMTTGLVGPILLAYAAHATNRRLPARRWYVQGEAILTLAALVSLVALTAALDRVLPVAIDPRLSPGHSGGVQIVGSPGVLVAQLVATTAWAIAAAGYVGRAGRTHDSLTAWLSVVAVLSAFGRLNYFLFPSRFSDYVFTGDFFRLGAYLVLLVAAAREISAYSRTASAAAALEERRRVARDIHDGLAQELAFIVRESRSLSDDGEPVGGPIHSAAQRALDEARAAVHALGRAEQETLDDAVARAAEDVASREGLRLVLRLQEGIEIEAGRRESLVRIVREAVTNAARHGGAERVVLELGAERDLVLAIRDEGRGFDPKARSAGYGLRSMRERTEALGGRLVIESEPGKGTTIEVVMPWTSRRREYSWPTITR